MSEPTKIIIPNHYKLPTLRVLQAGHRILEVAYKSYTILNQNGYHQLTVTDGDDKVTELCFSFADCAITLLEAGQS